MAVRLQLGEHQLPVDGEFETPAIRWHQGDRFNIRLKLIDQLGYQTGSPVGVVSDCTVDEIELQ